MCVVENGAVESSVNFLKEVAEIFVLFLCGAGLRKKEKERKRTQIV